MSQASETLANHRTATRLTDSDVIGEPDGDTSLFVSTAQLHKAKRQLSSRDRRVARENKSLTPLSQEKPNTPLQPVQTNSPQSSPRPNRVAPAIGNPVSSKKRSSTEEPRKPIKRNKTSVAAIGLELVEPEDYV